MVLDLGGQRVGRGIARKGVMCTLGYFRCSAKRVILWGDLFRFVLSFPRLYRRQNQ